MTTYDEVQHQDPYAGMVTCDEPIMASPNYKQQQTPKKAHSPPMHQAPPPVVSQDSQFSGFTALTSISQQQQRHQAPSTVGSTATERPLNVADELKERQSWAVGTVIEVFSSSAAKWYIAQVAQVGEKTTAHMITVQFVGDNGQIMQKSMPRSDVQLANFGRNTRQMPPGFQKVASQSRAGEFSYLDSSNGQKYQTKELAWQNYYANILKSEQAQNLLKQQSLLAPPGQQAAAERLAAEKLKPQGLQPAPTMSVAPSAPVAKAADGLSSISSDLYAGAHGPDPVLAKSFQQANVSTAYYTASSGGSVVNQMPRAKDVYAAHTASEYGSDVGYAQPRTEGASSPMVVRSYVEQRPQTMSDLPSFSSPPEKQSSGLQPSKPFPGYGKSFAVGTNEGYEAYLAQLS